MNKDNVSLLLQRFLVARDEGKELYFDADQIEDMLDSFEDSDDYTYYDEVLTLGLKLHPGNNELHIKQGRLLVYNEDYDRAMALMDTISETENQDLDTLRIECYCMQDKYDKALEYTEQLINNNCDYLEDIFEYIAPLLSDMDMNNEAMDYIDRGLRLFPDNLILKDELCYNLETAGDIEKAIRVCNELIDVNPYSYEYWFTLGRLYSIANKYDKAIEAFDFALTCDDSDLELKILKAYCLYMNESYEKAIEVYKEIQPNNEEDINRIKPLMGECYTKLEKYEEAYPLLKEYIYSNANKDDPSAYINYIHCCRETKHLVEAGQILTKAVELFPDNVRILSLLSIFYMENNNPKLVLSTTDKLFKVLGKTKESMKEDCDAMIQTGKYMFDKDDFESALRYYKKVLEVNPNTPYIHTYMSLVYLMLGDPKIFEHLPHIDIQENIKLMDKLIVEINKEGAASASNKPIAPEDLSKEFLKNKDNNN